MQIYDKDGFLICPNPIEITIEDVPHFTIIDGNCNQIYKNSIKEPSKCGEFILLKIIDPKHNQDGCEEVVDLCANPLVFLPNPLRKKLNNYTEFEVYVTNNNNKIVQFKSSYEDWKDATIGTNGVKIKTLNSGLCEEIKIRLKNCTQEYYSCFTAYSNSEYQDGDRLKVAEWLHGNIHLTLYVYFLNNAWYLVRITDNLVEIVPTGTNLLESQYTYNKVIPSNIQIQEYVTGFDGFTPPENFPYNLLASYLPQYQLIDNIFWLNGDNCVPVWVDTNPLVLECGAELNSINNNSTYNLCVKYKKQTNQCNSEIKWVQHENDISCTDCSSAIYNTEEKTATVDCTAIPTCNTDEDPIPLIFSHTVTVPINTVVGSTVINANENAQIKAEYEANQYWNERGGCQDFADSSDFCGEQSIQVFTKPLITETLTNSYNFSSLYTNNNNSFQAFAGLCFPIFRGQTDTLEPIKAGWTSVGGANYYPFSIAPGNNLNTFGGFQYNIQGQIYPPTGEVSTSDGNIIGAAKRALVQYDTLEALLRYDFQTLNHPSMDDALMALAAQAASNFSWVEDPQNHAIGTFNAYLNDNETEINGGGIHKVHFEATMSEYLTKMTGTKVIYYGYPASDAHWFSHHYYRDILPSQYSVWSTKTPMGTKLPRPDGQLWFDGQSGYVKSPIPVQVTIYEKDELGNYILLNNKRKLRTDAFQEYLFGVKNTWHPEPWNPYSLDYTPISTLNRTVINTITGVQVTDIEFAVATPYRFTSLYRTVMDGIAFNYNKDKTSYFKSSYYPVAVQSLLTEPYTAGQNATWKRWISKDQIRFNAAAAILSGFAGIYIYEDGFQGNPFKNPEYPIDKPYNLPYKGEVNATAWWFYENYQERGITNFNLTGPNPTYIFEPQGNLSRFTWITQTVKELQDLLVNYVKDETLRYLHFNKKFEGIDGREIIALGLYQGNKGEILLYYPFADPDDTFEITLYAGVIPYTLVLHGREAKGYSLTGNFTNLNSEDFYIIYNNVDNVPKKQYGNSNERES